MMFRISLKLKIIKKIFGYPNPSIVWNRNQCKKFNNKAANFICCSLKTCSCIHFYVRSLEGVCVMLWPRNSAIEIWQARGIILTYAINICTHAYNIVFQCK